MGVLPSSGDLERLDAGPVRAFAEDASAPMVAEVDAAEKDGDTLGGVVEVLVYGLTLLADSGDMGGGLAHRVLDTSAGGVADLPLVGGLLGSGVTKSFRVVRGS